MFYYQWKFFKERKMRVNNINTNTSFSRAIRVLDAQTGHISSKYDDEKMSSIRELQNVLNSGESEVYPDSTAQKIRIFFKQILGDYNGENGIIIKPFGKEIILFSGEEARKLKQLDSQAAYTKEQVDRSCHMKRKRKDAIIHNAQKKVTMSVFNMLENSKAKKPNSTLQLSFKDEYIKSPEFKLQQKIETISYFSRSHKESNFSKNEPDFEIPYYNSVECDSLDI